MLQSVKGWTMELLRDEEGASLVEYILLVALIAVVCIAAITLLGKSAKGKFETTANTINGTS
jgi:pilus assembly protein Flp/PilA